MTDLLSFVADLDCADNLCDDPTIPVVHRLFMGWPVYSHSGFAFVQIGDHRLFMGDAYEIRAALGWMDCDCMDPPYEIKLSGGGKFRKARSGSDMIVADKIDKGFTHEIINPLQSGSVVVFCHNDQLPDLGTYLKRRFNRFILGGWAKLNPMPMCNKHYLYDTDYYWHAWNKGWHPIGSVAQKRRFVADKVQPAKKYDHGTVKPEAVMDKIMANINGQTVCDPFMGTGSTGVAAVKAGKTFTGIEHNPKHFQTAVLRIRAAYEAHAG